MVTKGQIVEIPETSLVYKREVPTFLSKKEFLMWNSKPIAYSLFDGFLVGGHSGIENFKMGQRKGINVGGKKEPLYVIQIDEQNNRLFVGAGKNHPGLLTRVISFDAAQLQWIEEDVFSLDELENEIAVEITSSVVEEKTPALLFIIEEQGYLEFEKPVSIIVKEHPITILYKNNFIATIN